MIIPWRKHNTIPEAVDLVGIDRIGELFVDMYNPHTGEWYYTDPAYFGIGPHSLR